ncbi:hypothetical protein [Streptomyces sp. NRRL S-37]|uniref:hypothetical protein n=1 Tax=Streptomyces sp. NRRL S-37 TaxID=1463903 RepID=UPI0004C486EA|nr:hypothetical protein [Streptomyces sp. NRRL S-37]
MAAGTDDPIGTRAPVRRITDPDEAIAAPEHAVPALLPHRRSAAAARHLAFRNGGRWHYEGGAVQFLAE